MISSIIGISIFAGSQLRTTSLDAVVGAFDDFVYLSVSNNLKEGRGFSISHTPLWEWLPLSTDDLIQKFPNIIFPDDTHGPLYYLFLAGFLELTSSLPVEYHLMSSFFNTIITIFFLLTYFLFCRKYFGRNVAFFSTLIIALSSILVWYSVRILAYPLVFLFMTTAFIFLGKTNRHYLLFGVFAGLATLTHPIGILAGLSYVVFLLFKREFKGSLIVFVISALLLLPWMIRNMITFGSVGALGKGIALPSDLILNFFTSSNKENISIMPSTSVNPYTIFSETFNNAINFYHINLIIFLSVFSLIFIFVLFGTRFFKKPNSKLYTIFSTNSEKTRLFLFIFCFLFFNFLILFIFANISGYSPEITYLITSLYLLIPIGIFGMEKIFSILVSASQSKKPILVFSIIGIILIPYAISNSVSGFQVITDYNIKSSVYDKIRAKDMLTWIYTNLPSDSIISTDWPSLVSTRTGLKAIGFPSDFALVGKMEKYLNHYKPDYLVWYNVPAVKEFFLYTGTNYFFIKIHEVDTIYHTGEKSTIFKVVRISDDLASKIKEIKSSNENIDAKTFVQKLFYDSYGSVKDLNNIMLQATNFEMSTQYDDALLVYDTALQIQPLDFDYWEGKIRVLIKQENYGEAEKTFDKMFLIYDKIIRKLESNEGDEAFKHAELLYISALKGEANMFASISNESKELNTYNKILEIDRFNVDALLHMAEIYEKRGAFDLAIHTYENVLNLVDEPQKIQFKIDELRFKLYGNYTSIN